MISLDGLDYPYRSPLENTAEIVSFVNSFCANKGIKNSHGEVIYIEQNMSSPLYILFFGLGYITSILQRLLYSIGCAFNIQAASDRQMLLLAEVAGLKRRPATRTTISGLAYATATVGCTITPSLTYQVLTSEGVQLFHPAQQVVVPANAVRRVILVAEQPGPISSSAVDSAAFTETVPGLRQLSLQPSVPGANIETNDQLRARLQERTVMQTQLDKAIAAIKNLPGVTACNILFNYHPSEEALLGGIQVPPRQAALFIQGDDASIPITFYSHLLCLTAQADGSIKRDYVTTAGQRIPVYYLPPTAVPIYFRVYTAQEYGDDTLVTLKDAIGQLVNQLQIGSPLNTTMVLKHLSVTASQFNLKTVQLGLKDPETTVINYTYEAAPKGNELLVIDFDKIEVIQP